MSVSEFSKLLKTRIQTNVVRTLDEFEKKRKTLETAKYHQAVITRGSLKTLVAQFSDPKNEFRISERGVYLAGSHDEINDVRVAAEKALKAINFADFANYMIQASKSNTTVRANTGYNTEIIEAVNSYNTEKGAKSTYYATGSDKSTLILENVTQNALRDALIKYISKTPSIPKEHPKILEFLKANLQAGHLSGIFTLKLQKILGAEYDESKNTFNDSSNEINSILKLLLDADYLSSNLTGHRKLVMRAEKSMHGANIKAVTELQLSKLNSDSGSALTGLGVVLGQIGKILKTNHPNADTEIEKRMASVLSALQRSVDIIISQYTALKDTTADRDSIKAMSAALKNATYVQDLIRTKSSPSIVDYMTDNLISLLKNGKQLPKIISNVNITTNIKDGSSALLNKNIKKLKEDVQSLAKTLAETSKKIKKPKETVIRGDSKLRTNKGQFTSLANLQALLNQALSQQIKQNMIKPGLINRTGRFAESVKVERLSQSREGVISAFYSYMKSPYQTFEPGFKQGSAARNPKTLISKSIREIAAGLVGNRLRAVSL